MGEVLTPARFAGRLAPRLGVDEGRVVVTDKDWTALALPHPSATEPVIGTLTGEEASLFFELHALHEQMGAEARRTMAQSLSRQAEAVSSGRTVEEISQMVHEGELVFGDIAERERYYAMAQRHNALHATFHYLLGQRLEHHAYRLGVRAGGKVVRVAPRWQLQPGAQGQ